MDKVDIIHMGGITGAGLYMVNGVAAGDCIFELPGTIMPASCARERHIRISKDFSLEQPRKFGKDYYLNHSCNPNCFIECHCGWPTLVARKKIQRDDELTINYNALYEYVEPFICYCDAPICIETVSGYGRLSYADKIFVQDDLTPYLLEMFENEKNGL